MNALNEVPTVETVEADEERRFGGLRRLYGGDRYERIRELRIAVVGLGGVGSWAAEALARSGVGGLVLIDLDHVAESNINRQVQALGSTVGQSKALALAHRIHDIHPTCHVHTVEEFVDEENWPGLLVEPVSVVIDACDSPKAKLLLATWALRTGVYLVCCGAAGGKQNATQLEVGDLLGVTHDPLLASLRHKLRRDGLIPRTGRAGLRCVFSKESVTRPGEGCDMDGSLNCHGYGSSVVVTATMGLIAAGEALALGCVKTEVVLPDANLTSAT
jgi:tRNA A37 threonylcarbamoyladenosine dehydratase